MEVKKLNGGALTFLVSNIDPDERRASRGFLDRTALLKIPPDTILESGRTVVDEDKFLNKEKPSAPPPAAEARIAIVAQALLLASPLFYSGG